MSPIRKFRTANEALNLTGKTALIVGGTQGIGKAVAIQLATLGASVSVAGRNETAGANAVNELNACAPAAAQGRLPFSFHKVDVSLVSDIKRFVGEVLPQYESTGLNYLFLTAGHPPNGERTETAEGVEHQFAVQCLSRFTIAELLVPVLKRAQGGARVIDVMQPGAAKSIDLEDLEIKNGPYSFMSVNFRDSAYNDIVSKAFASRHSSDSIAFHHIYPGIVATNATKNMPWYLRYPTRVLLPVISIKPEVCAEVLVYAATAAEFATGGRLLNDSLEDVKSTDFMSDSANWDKVWNYSTKRAGLD
ncbi:hypothetical protein BC938DRAFT_483231 [Jimgerdemannia flammicorona]|uniref:NAD(P)-binding protein n=1 Tax=Jimgerdemannia flammicorona TaxID=994334 RepID=A0A433QCF1_9FUNG|nr:hypothetical protein BC938DRAFT_483231 [Jimgerdemannia flammicorona]